MKKINLDPGRYKKKSKITNPHADLVFGYFDKWDIDYKNKWNKRMAGKLMRDAKKNGRGFVERKMGLADESLTYMEREMNATYKAIMKDQESKGKFFWNKLVK
jgi:hypothetical protein